MRIRVFTKDQDVSIEKETHLASAGLSHYAVSGGFARPLRAEKGKVTEIQLITNECWFSIKTRYASLKHRDTAIPVIKAPRLPENLILSYPLTNQETDGRRKSRELWARAFPASVIVSA